MKKTWTLCIVSLLAGCVTLQENPPNLLTTEQEVELGKQFATEIEKKETILENPDVQAYVREIGDRIARVADRQDVTYTFNVIDAPDTVNAFALPGGYMYIYTGLMKLCRNEAELASVMAHEIGHVAAHHHGEAMTRQLGLSFVLSLVLGEDPSQSAATIANLLGTGFSMRYSRGNERESDELGMEYLFRAGYKPDAMLTFMHKMQAEQAGTGARPVPFFSSHPATEERISLLNAQVQRYPSDFRFNSPLYPDRYQKNALEPLE